MADGFHLDISGLLRKLYDLKKTVLSSEDYFRGEADDANDIAILTRDDNHTVKLGIFSLKGKSAAVAVPFPDGAYVDHLTGETVAVSGGRVLCDGRPMVLSRQA